MISSHNGIFTTPETALAAYLQSEGYELLEIDNSNPRKCKFSFSNNDQRLAQLVFEFGCGKATGNIIKFYDCYRKLVDDVKSL